MTPSDAGIFSRHVSRQVFENCNLPPHISMLVVNKIPPGPPVVTVNRNALHINTTDEHSGDALLFDAVKKALETQNA